MQVFLDENLLLGFYHDFSKDKSIFNDQYYLTSKEYTENHRLNNITE